MLWSSQVKFKILLHAAINQSEEFGGMEGTKSDFNIRNEGNLERGGKA